MLKNVRIATLIANVIAIIITSIILIGSTFAWFTDSVSSTGNKIQAGTLEIDLKYLDKDEGWVSLKNETKPVFDCDAWEPGYTDVKIFKIENNGNLALQWKAKIIAETGLSKLADVIDVYVLPNKEEPEYPGRDLVGYTRVGKLSEFVNSVEETTKGILLGNDYAYLSMALVMPTTVGNEYQGLSLGESFDIVIVATQVSIETDGIGSEYDDKASYPVVATTAQALKDAMLVHNAKITLESDILVSGDTPLQWGSYMFVANGREVTIDLNGHDIIFDETASRKVLYVFTTANGGTLNVKGEGSVVVANKMTGIFRAMNKNDQINVYGGTYISNCVEGKVKDCSHLMYTNSGNIDVYGGKFYYPSAEWCANAENIQGDRLSIVIHEGTLLQQEGFQSGDATRIQLAEGCIIEPVEIDGETWYQVVLNN